jgi:hypothetical protein
MAVALAACVYRQLSLPTFKSIMELMATHGNEMRLVLETGDALISRSRSLAVSQWLMQHPDDDVIVMTDDDFLFDPAGIMALVDLCRETKGIVAGVTPLRSGHYTAIVPLDDQDMAAEPWRDPASPPQQIKWAGGLIAYHRSVFEKLSHTLPLLHKNDANLAPFWPFFACAMTTSKGQDIYLSEDYSCHERARRLGVEIWVQPKCQVGHLAEIIVSSKNLEQVHALFNDTNPVGVIPEPSTLP